MSTIAVGPAGDVAHSHGKGRSSQTKKEANSRQSIKTSGQWDKKVGIALIAINPANTKRPPMRSVNMPIGIRASEPRSTGAPTNAALWVRVSPNGFRNCGAKALIRPHAAKQSVNEIVPNARCSESLDCDSIFIVLFSGNNLVKRRRML
jgi:hypothetical protein